MLELVISIAVLIVIGYGFGCFSTGYFVGKMYGIDIRNSGSGNVGTTNALRTLGKKAGLLTFLGDFLKALIPCLIVFFIFSSRENHACYLYTLCIGLGVVLGHNYPFYLHFKGGKGIAVTAGVIVASSLDWRFVGAGLVIFITVVAVTRYVSLGSLIVVWLIPLYTIIFYRDTPYFIATLCISLLFTVSGYNKHRSNIKRLLNGTENKLTAKKKGAE